MLRKTLLLLLILTLTGCAHPYLGRTVNTQNQYWGQCNRFPAHCTLQDQWFKFEFTVNKGTVDGEYFIKGWMDGTDGRAKSFTHFVSGETRFTLLMAKDGKIVTTKAFYPNGEYLDRALPFTATFKSQPFDAVTITWKATVRG